MDNSEYQRTWFKRRYAQDPEFRAHRQEINRDYRRERYASDPEFRNSCLESGRRSRLKRRHGITVTQLDAQLAAQRGACACCHQKLGRALRIDHPVTDAIEILCVGCHRRVGILRHVLQYADRFEAYFKQCGMTAHLKRLYATLRMCGRRPAQTGAQGQPS